MSRRSDAALLGVYLLALCVSIFDFWLACAKAGWLNTR